MSSDQSKAKVDWRNNHYGYSWFVTKNSLGLGEFFHPGAIDGFQSLLYIGYEQKFEVVALSNGGDTTGKIINKIVREACLL